MGREIRMVPLDWRHPTDESDNYIPLEDKTYQEALQQWQEDGCHPDEEPQPEWYRPAYTSEPVAFQVYETVTEGTPVSPVFESEDDLRTWLSCKGHSQQAIDKFVKLRWAPSMIIGPSGVRMGIDALG